MTLLINDFCMRGDLRDGYILTVADRRLSYDKTHPKHHKPEHATKVFEITRLNAAIGYFGLAYFRSNIQHDSIPLSPWLQSFINHYHIAKTIGEFAEALCDKLNSLMEKKDVEKGITGFHICGYNQDDIPEFWVVRNIGNDYSQPCLNYYLCDEVFPAKDAAKVGYDGENPNIGFYRRNFYINGDPEPFHRIWHPLSAFVDGMIQRGGFGKRYDPLAQRTDEDLRKIAKWQMKVIGDFYSQFGDKGKKIIGGSSDAIVLRPKKQLPKRVAIVLQGGPLNGQIYALNDSATNAIRVLNNLKDEERAGRLSTVAEVSSDGYLDFAQYSYYLRTERDYNGSPIFAFNETPPD